MFTNWISRSHRLKNRRFKSNLSNITRPAAAIKSLRFPWFFFQNERFSFKRKSVNINVIICKNVCEDILSAGSWPSRFPVGLLAVLIHEDIIKWKHFPRYWPFVQEFTVTGEFPTQRPVTRSFDVFFDLCLNKRLSKQSWGWWFDTLSRPLWRHCDETTNCHKHATPCQ